MEIPKNATRRKFLKTGLVAGALVAGGTLGASELISAIDSKPTGNKIKLLSPDGKIVEVDASVISPSVAGFLVSNHNVRQGVPGKKFVMVIDLSKCKNARKCHKACSKMHYLPENRSYIKVNKMQDSPEASPYWMPTPCFHCDNPPCVKVCPVGATFKLSDGIVGIDNARCIGCRFCMVACPYNARVFNWGEEMFHLSPEEKNAIKPHEACGSHVVGTVEKCDFCPQKTGDNKLPDCVEACPNGVFYFGDEVEDVISNGDETLQLSKVLRDKAGYRFMEDLGTKPRVYYLPPVDRQFPFTETKQTSK